jgi:hypothetical protein
MRASITRRRLGSRLVLLSIAVVFVAAVAANALPNTTPISGPPNTTPTAVPPPCSRLGGCNLSTMTISPRSGPVGTVVTLHAVCAHFSTPPAVVVGSLIAASDGYVAAPVDITATPVSGPPGQFAFTGTFTIPDTLYSSDRAGEMTPRPTAPGLHSVWARCYGTAYGEPWDTLPMQNFCVTPSPLCSSYSRYFGSWSLYPALFLSHVATLLSAPPPPETTTTTTTRPRTTPQTSPPQPPPPPPPPTPTTCTTSYVKPTPPTTCGP